MARVVKCPGCKTPHQVKEQGEIILFTSERTPPTFYCGVCWNHYYDMGWGKFVNHSEYSRVEGEKSLKDEARKRSISVKQLENERHNQKMAGEGAKLAFDILKHFFGK